MFAKVFGQIFDSSIAEDYNCRRMFMDLLVLADSTGAVDMTYEAISRRTNVPVEEVVKYVKELCQPDEKSRSKLEEGKRLIPLDSQRDWGWQIVNYTHYRGIKDEEARRSYFRDAQRKWRLRHGKGKKKPSGDHKLRTDGFIYYVKSGDEIKIGYAKNPRERMAEMKIARPDIVLLRIEKAPQEKESERHKQFQSLWIKGEWFKAGEELMSFISSLPVFDASLTPIDKVGQVLTSPSASSSASYLEDLKKNPLHALIDIDRELEKARQWCKRKNRRLTQRFFDNWLKKADRSIPDPSKPKHLPPINDTPQDQREKILAAARSEVGKLSQQFKMP